MKWLSGLFLTSNAFGKLKKINVRDVKLGMYIQKICGSWMASPFWKKSFKLTDPKDLKKLAESSIHEVWIDTVKGKLVC